MVRTKVFVGNLAFSTKEPELAAAFGVAGKVIGANIITRGPRSLGYGFVEMESEEDAKKAVEAMNKKDVNGRQINVEIAKPQEETKPNAEPGENGAKEEKKRRPRKRAPLRRQGAAPESASEEGGQGQPQGEGEAAKRRPKRRGPRGAAPKRDSEEGAAANREESKTTLFVANLPFSLDDEGFAKVVGELGIKAKTAHVVKKRNGRSKGYGFVEFETEADQRKALEGLNKKSVEGRELSVKIALTERPGQEGEESPAEKKVQKPAAAEKKPAPAAEKKTVPAAEKKPSSPGEKKAAAPAEKKAAASEKKSTPPAEKKAEKDTPAAKETKATDK
jgi:RNA recognition motif-containing protein